MKDFAVPMPLIPGVGVVALLHLKSHCISRRSCIDSAGKTCSLIFNLVSSTSLA